MRMRKSALLLIGVPIVSFILIRNFYVNNLKYINSIKKEVFSC